MFLKDGFLLDQRQLVPTGKETWEGIKVYFIFTFTYIGLI